jgi:hypothetical protein
LGRIRKMERDGKAKALGLGPERILIALLSRKGFLRSWVFPIWRRVRPVIQFRH